VNACDDSGSWHAEQQITNSWRAACWLAQDGKSHLYKTSYCGNQELQQTGLQWPFCLLITGGVAGNESKHLQVRTPSQRVLIATPRELRLTHARENNNKQATPRRRCHLALATGPPALHHGTTAPQSLNGPPRSTGALAVKHIERAHRLGIPLTPKPGFTPSPAIRPWQPPSDSSADHLTLILCTFCPPAALWRLFRSHHHSAARTRTLCCAPFLRRHHGTIVRHGHAHAHAAACGAPY